MESVLRMVFENRQAFVLADNERIFPLITNFVDNTLNSSTKELPVTNLI